MKLKLAAILLATTFLANADWKAFEDLKTELYKRQRGVMDEAKYKKIITPFIEEGKANLEVGKYVLNAKTPVASVEKYMKAFVDYAVAQFNSHTPKGTAGPFMALQKAIEAVKKEANLKFDVSKELADTKDLVQRANATYYSKISYYKRGLIFIAS